MKPNMVVVIFTLFSLSIMINIVAQTTQKDVQSIAPSVRARSIELVDAKGQTRASLLVETNGETVFRLKDSDGTIRVKLGASKDGSGFVLLDDATNVGVHVLAQSTGTSLTLINKNGQKKTINP